MRKTLFWLNANEAVLVITTVLLIIGCINVFSSSFVLANQLMNDSYFFLWQHLKALAIGALGFLLIVRIGYRRLLDLTPVFMISTIVILAAVLLVGEEANGARRWLRIGMKFQPSELAKLTVILLNSVYLGARLAKRQAISLCSPPMFFTIIISGLVLNQPDMGTALVIMGLGITLHLLAGIPRMQVLALILGGLATFIYFIFTAAYRADRIWAWLDPWQYQQSIGYQSVQSLLAIGSGGFSGTGFGKGVSKFYYLPEAHTDFAFAVLSQETGFIGVMVVLLLLAGMAFYGTKIALEALDNRGMLLASGIIILILGQAIGNIAMVCGVIPVAGVPLPFISYGGTSLMANLFALGFIISVGRHTTKAVIEQPPPEEPKRPKLSLVP